MVNINTFLIRACALALIAVYAYATRGVDLSTEVSFANF